MSGTVQEFRPGGATTANLTTTELASPDDHASSRPATHCRAPTVVGTGGRVPPDAVIEDDATGDVETSGTFDPASDGLDFWESLEGMRVAAEQRRSPSARPTPSARSPVVGDDGANAAVRTARGGLIVTASDFNPERVVLDDLLDADARR